MLETMFELPKLESFSMKGIIGRPSERHICLGRNIVETLPLPKLLNQVLSDNSCDLTGKLSLISQSCDVIKELQFPELLSEIARTASGDDL